VSLSDQLRDELAGIAPRRECDRLAELSALFHTAGSAHLRGRGEVAVHLDVSSSGVARRAFSLLRSFGIASEIRTYRRRAFDRATRYELHVAGRARALQVLHEAGVVGASLAPLAHPPARVVGRACCRAAYLRGALLGAGSVSGPADAHLELRTASREGADFLQKIAAAEGVALRVRERAHYATAYAKSAEAIGDLLAAAGSSDVALSFQEHAVLRVTRAHANRLANADHANLVRTSRAAAVQLEAVRRLERTGELGRLPARLREAAELRARHPGLSLRELGLKSRPPSTKVAMQRRLAKLVRLAKP
jgi:cell division protein WhiA